MFIMQTKLESYNLINMQTNEMQNKCMNSYKLKS